MATHALLRLCQDSFFISFCSQNEMCVYFSRMIFFYFINIENRCHGSEQRQADNFFLKTLFFSDNRWPVDPFMIAFVRQVILRRAMTQSNSAEIAIVDKSGCLSGYTDGGNLSTTASASLRGLDILPVPAGWETVAHWRRLWRRHDSVRKTTHGGINAGLL